jgi:flagellar motor switch protein FliG
MTTPETARAALEAAREGPLRPTLGLDRAQKAAIVIGALGPEAAGPVLAALDESALRAFTGAMARLRRVDQETVRLVVAEFLDAVRERDLAVRGGLQAAREVLEPHVAGSLLDRLLEDVDGSGTGNVWKKLAQVPDEALAEFLSREHSQTAAVVLSKLSAEQAARVLDRFEPERAREAVMGLTRAQSLDPGVIEAIGASISRDFLSGHAHAGPRRDPAERVGAIMNYVAAETREAVLGHFETTQPAFAEEIRRKMFTFEDIPRRLAPRDMAAVLRECERETLVVALRHAREAGSEAGEFVLSGLSSRIGAQIREEMAEIDKPRRRDGEAAQTAVIAAIRALEARGEVRLMTPEDD